MVFYQLIVLCLLFAIWRLWSKKAVKPLSEPPELSGRLPIVGHAYMILGDSVKMYKTVTKISEEILQKGGVITLRLGLRKVYGIADPEDSLTIMNTSLEKHYMYDFYKPLLGNGLFTVDAQTWKKNRKILNLTFSQQVLDSYIGVFNEQAQILVDRFATELGKPIDHFTYLKFNNLETICSTSLGISCDTEDDSNLLKQYLSRFMKAIQMTNERVQNVWLHSDFMYNMTQKKKNRDTEMSHLFKLSEAIIEKYHNSTLKDTEKNEDQPKTFIDIILNMANSTESFTDKQIREEMNTIIAAGHDTIASLLTFALTLLGSHTDVQEKAYEEIRRLNCEKNIEKNVLSKLVYNEAILKETLRLYPIGPISARYINNDIKLRNYTIKANSECFISIYGIQRHSIWGPDADQFRPERWLEKDTLPDPKYFVAFGLGRRSCIGKVYAMMSMKITLAHILRKYRISSDVNKMVVDFQLLIRPKSGHYITLINRNK